MTTQLLNTLFVTTQGAYVHLQNDTVAVEIEQSERQRIPMHHLGALVTFGNVMLSPFLIGRLLEEGKHVSLHDTNGRFLGRICGPTHGNVLLRQAQYAALASDTLTSNIAAMIVEGKIKNSKSLLVRAARENEGEDQAYLKEAVARLKSVLGRLHHAQTLEELRGYEGEAARLYFDALKRAIKPSLRDIFAFDTRTKRPPRDAVNALLSFLYTLVMHDCVSACEGVGLDPQAGFLHALRPGKAALALDLMEELRAPLADKLALTLINRKQIAPDDFEPRPGGSVYLNDKGRKSVVIAYQTQKQEELTHPLLKEKVPIGMIAHLQARILARFLRGDIDRYIPVRLDR